MNQLLARIRRSIFPSPFPSEDRHAYGNVGTFPIGSSLNLGEGDVVSYNRVVSSMSYKYDVQDILGLRFGDLVCITMLDS